MKLKNLQWVACALVASVALVGCSKDISSDFDSNGGANQSGDVRIKTNLVLDDVASSEDLRGLQEELRLSIINKDKTAEGKYNGVRFQFEDNEQVPLYTYFKQNGQIFVADTVHITIKGTKEVGSGSAKTTYWAGLTELKVPRGIDLSASAPEVTVAGAIGVERIDATGKATVKPMEVEADGDVEFQASVPMYFPEMKLNKADTTLRFKHADGTMSPVPHLRFYGALVSLSFQNKMYDPVRLSQAVFETAAFTTEGQMDLTTASETADPQWTSTQDGTTFQKINFDGKEMPKNGKKDTFLWVKPESYAGTRQATVYIREDNFTIDPSERSEAITKRYNLKPFGRKVYRFPEIEVTSGLIFTDVNYDATNGSWEIYNPTIEDIDLGEYTIVRLDYNGSTGAIVENSLRFTNLLSSELYFSVDKTDDNRSGMQGSLKDLGNLYWNNRTTSPSSLILAPGETALYLAADIGVPSFVQSRDKVAYVFKFRTLKPEAWYDGAKTAFNTSALPARHMYFLVKGMRQGIDLNLTDLKSVTDVFFGFKDADSRRTINNRNYIRRPDRNFGRKFWAKGDDGPNSDWVHRDLNNNDMGYRFGWYYDKDSSAWKVFSGKGAGWGLDYLGGLGTAKVSKFWTQGVAH